MGEGDDGGEGAGDLSEAHLSLDPVRWGVLGASNFALTTSVPAMQRGPLTVISALASRDSGKAHAAAARLGIPRAYGSTVFGKPVRYQAVAPSDWPRYMTEKWGVPAELSKSTVGTMQAVETGEFDLVSSDYREITGKPARPMREFLESVRDGAKSS